MKKIISLIKASLSSNMNLFKIKSKSKSRFSRMMMPIILFCIVFFYIWTYANVIMEPLVTVKLEYVLLTIFVLFTSIFTLAEGIYKSSSLLFNCHDDNLLLSLPIKKSTILFVRILKFYLFELLYNSLFLIPSIVVYIRYVDVNLSFYVVSIIMILLLPIIPIVLSCLIGFIITYISSKFKYKNIMQTIVTTLFLLVILYISFNFKTMINSLAIHAKSINDIITKIYYSAGVYNKLVISFQIKDLLTFIIVNIFLLLFMIFVLSNVYFKINSSSKNIKVKHKNSYKIVKNCVIFSLIKKELNKFINTPVFIINTGFGLILFIIGCLGFSIKYDTLVTTISNIEEFKHVNFENIIPIILFGLVIFSSFMTSITSSMISLEGKSFNILKSLPINASTIIKSKVLTAILIMIPIMLIGDLVFFLRFNFSIIQILLCLSITIIMPIVAEEIGIIVNLKYPKMDAENDTEVVKQSMSSFISVMIGMVSSFLSIYILYEFVINSWSINLIMIVSILVMAMISYILWLYIKKYSSRDFNKITI